MRVREPKTRPLRCQRFMRRWQWRGADLVVLRDGRGVVAAAALVAFNLLMLVLAALGPIPMEAPFLVAWISGDAVLSLAALALTEHS